MESLMVRLKKLASKYRVLYAEDNEGLRTKAAQYLKKFFKEVVIARDGKEGLELFKKDPTKIVITDIQMPNMNGLDMLRAIKEIDPKVKCVVTTAYNEVDYLHESIDIGVYNYLVKPINSEKFVELLTQLLEDIELEKSRALLDNYMNNIFNSQNDLLLLIQNRKLLIANDTAIKFFNYETVKNFREDFDSFGNFLKPHGGFLYNHDEVEWLSEVEKNFKKLYHVKFIINDNIYHFVLKANPLKNNEEMVIFSFQDITELKLLGLFDQKRLTEDQEKQGNKSIFKLLEMAHNNSLELKLQNFYKGLSITNKAVITSIEDDVVTLSTSYVQQKALQHEKRIFIISDLFPAEIESKSIVSNNLDTQSIKVKDLHLIPKSISKRDYIRLVPEPEHKITLFFEKRKFNAETEIIDISVKSMRIKMDLIPAGFHNEKVDVRVDIVFVLSNLKKEIINTPVNIYRIEEYKHHFEVILLFESDEEMRKKLVNYISQRQMALIREFKGFQYAK